MAIASKIKVMISSRCKDKFPTGKGRRLSQIRKGLKKEIEGLKVFGKPVFEVWINEDVPPKGGSWDAWDVCMQAVRDCDILLALSNGNAGWAKEGSEIGICHAELMTALDQAPGKVRIINLGRIRIRKSSAGQRNKRFQEYLALRNLFHGAARNERELKAVTRAALGDVLISLAQAGVREVSRGDMGDALGWSRLNFENRELAMRNALRSAILERKDSKQVGDNVIVRMNHKKVLLVTHAIPAAFSVGPAKEMVGQPFLRDYKFFKYLKKEHSGGPMHVIACQKTATEAQAMKLLGFPDATVVSTPFGVFVADNIQKVQFAFIANCHDETTTRHGVQRFFEWLAQSGEQQYVTIRAQARARIVHAIVNASPSKPGRIRHYTSRSSHNSPKNTVKRSLKKTGVNRLRPH